MTLDYRAAYLVRPAEGGMRAQVRSLLEAAPVPLAAAPEAVLSFLERDLPGFTGLPLGDSLSFGGQLRAGVRAGRWAKANKAELIHGHGIRWSPLFWAASLTSGLPLVVTLHNLLPELPVPVNLILRMTLSHAKRLVCVSEAVANKVKLLSSSFVSRVRTVYNGINLDRFQDSNIPTKEKARQQLGLSQEIPVALCIARLSPEKDVSVFMEAANWVHGSRTTRYRAHYLIVGDGPLRSELEHKAAAQYHQDRIQLLGQRDDIPLLLRAADVYCQPSREEGLGIAAIEAMASGLPVVATRVGGLPEVVENHKTGLLVPPGAPAALADALRALFADPALAEQMGRAGRARAERLFGRETMLSTTNAVYAEVVN